MVLGWWGKERKNEQFKGVYTCDTHTQVSSYAMDSHDHYGAFGTRLRYQVWLWYTKMRTKLVDHTLHQIKLD